MTQKNGKYALPEGILVQDLEAEIVMLNINTQYYHGLNEMGTCMWKLLFEHGEVEPVVAALKSEYAATEAEIRKDVNDLLQELQDRGLITITE